MTVQLTKQDGSSDNGCAKFES